LEWVRDTFATVFGSGLRRTTIAATLLASGALSGRYVVTIWLPTYLSGTYRLDQTGVSAEMAPMLVGSVIGYLGGGYSQDRLGRRVTFAIFVVASAIATLLYVRVPAGADPLLALAGVLLGFCTSALLSGLGAYLSELFPTSVRGIGQGFSYSTGRAVAAVPVVIVGALATVEGLGAAIAISVVMYALCLIALRFLPETRGKSLTSS
jgi:MFS family permease